MSTGFAAPTRKPEPKAARPGNDQTWQPDPTSQAGVPRFLEGIIQPKLMVGAPDDGFEREADDVARAAEGDRSAPADRPARAGAPALQTRPAGGAVPGGVMPAEGASPLSPHVRSRVEPILDADLSGVQVHTGPASARAADQLKARAFTHGNHIWLGRRASPDDLDLLAHEATHVVQQRAAPGPVVQRSPEEYIHHEDGATVQSNMSTAVDEELEDVDESDREDAPDPSEMPPGERGRLKGELADDGALPADRAAEAQPAVDSASSDTKAEADQPADPLAEGAEQEPAEGEEEDVAGAAEAAAGLAAAAESPPEMPTPVVPILPFAPMDSEGATVAADAPADAATVTLTVELQRMREEGADARTRATVIKNNAGVMRGNLGLAQSQIDTAGEQLTAAEVNLAARREITTQGRNALVISEEKAAQVAAEAPGFVDRASAAHEDSGPMASEAGATAGEAAGQDPDDEEAAEKMGRIGGEMSSVSSDAGTVDSAVTQTQTRAESLVEDAAQAQEKNTATGEKLDATEESLDQADERLVQLGEQNMLAQTQISALMGGPGRMEAGASDLDSQAVGIIDHSTGLEAELRASEDTYQSEMRAIPGEDAIAAAAERGGGGGEGVIQRSAESAYGDRISVDLLSAFRSPPSAAELREQERRRLEADERRRARIRDIEARANGDFSSLSTLDRMSIALEVTGDNLWNNASDVDWPNMAGQVILAFIDPRVSLEGVITGLNGVLSGAANLFSLEQWERDPLGNLLKSSADIATGLTTILGSIAGLCTAILVILGALAIFTFGAMGPAFAAASAFLGPIISTVGGWALVTAAIAAELHALVFIKNLVDAATADTAAEMEHETDQMTEDATQFASAASEVVLDGLVEAGGARLANTPTGRSLGNAIEGVGRDFDMIPPPRVRPDMELPPAAALGEGAPPAAAAVETGPVPERAAPAAAAEAAPAAAVEPPAPIRPPEPAAVPELPPPPPPRPPEPAAATPPPPPARAPETAAPRPVGSAATAAATDVGPAPATTRPPETPPPVSPEPPRPPETPEPPRAVETPEPPRAVEAPEPPRTVEAPDQPRGAAETAAPETPTAAAPERGGAGAGEPPRTPDGGGGGRPPRSPDGASARAKIDEHLQRMIDNDLDPADLGFSSREWEQFGRDRVANPERALADLERRLDIHGGGRGAPGTSPDVERAAHADDVRDTPHPRTSESTTRAERAEGAAEGERAAAERRAAAEGPEPTGSHAPQERPSELFEDPDMPPPMGGEPLERPALRDETKAAIEAESLAPDGTYRDANDNIINEPTYGHKEGFENRRIVAAAQELGLTQQQLNDFVNDHPDYFFIEERATNLSHMKEMPGLEPYDHIMEAMEEWLRTRPK